MQKWVFKNKFYVRLLFSLLIVAIMVPLFCITSYAQKPGRIIGSILYMLFCMWGYYEILRVLKISWFSALITTFIVPTFILLKFGVYKSLIINGNYLGLTQMLTEALNSWETWVVSCIFFAVPFVSDLILFNRQARLWKIIIVAATSLLLPIFAKSIWIMNLAGLRYVLFFIGVAVCSDTFSYLGGLFWGKKLFKGAKFAPKISPKKTWAGYLIGAFLTSIYAILVGYFAHIWYPFGDFQWLVSLIFGVVFAFGTPYGDLLFSLFKRQARVKDFSGLIPGHGGIFDRLDSLTLVIVTATIFYLFANLV